MKQKKSKGGGRRLRLCGGLPIEREGGGRWGMPAAHVIIRGMLVRSHVRDCAGSSVLGGV